jgi:hypothetical protein
MEFDICITAQEEAMKKSKKTQSKTSKRTQKKDTPRCGLCGKTKNLTKTDCCDQWICDDEDQYVMFSFARNSCHRNHDRYTLCAYHYHEGHTGDWKTCEKCKADFESDLEMYVYYATNEYNFEKMENPPEYEPTKCAKCGSVIVLSEDAYTMSGEGYFCEKCMGIDLSELLGDQ